jgi:SAM-dependent methyltransferase
MHGSNHDLPPERTPKRFDPARAARLDDPARFAYLPPEAIVDFVDAPPQAIVLDFGCGIGTFALPFKARRPDCTVLGLDIEPSMLAYLNEKPGGDQIITGGYELLERYAGRIDRVLCVNVLHEFDHEHLVALVAALAPGAKVAMIDWNAEVERPAGPKKEHLFGPASASEYLARFGLVVEKSMLLPYNYALLAHKAS